MNQAEWNAIEDRKNRLEMAGARARFLGKPRNANPYLSTREREMALEFPDSPEYFKSEENDSAYYWEIGWENYLEWEYDLRKTNRI